MTTTPLLHVARVNNLPVRYFAARPHPSPPWIAVDDLLRALKVPSAERDSLVVQMKRAGQHAQIFFAETRTATANDASDREKTIAVTVTPIVAARKLVRLAMDGDGAYGRATDMTDFAFESGIDAAIDAMPEDKQGQVRAQLFIDVIGAVAPEFAKSFVDSLEGDGPLEFIPVEKLRHDMGIPEPEVRPGSARRTRGGRRGNRARAAARREH